MTKKEVSVEQSFLELDQIIGLLESEDTKLLDSIELYAKGVKLLKNCTDTLDRIEKQIIVLGETNDDE